MPRFPADVVIVEPTLRLSLSSTKSLPSLGLAYFTDGASWQASYQVILEGKDARVSGNAVVMSNTLNVADAELQLLAGDVGVSQQGSPMARRSPASAGVAYEMSAVQEQRVGEAHLYSVPGRVTLRPGETSLVALFEPTNAPVAKRLVVQVRAPVLGRTARSTATSRRCRSR